MAFRIDQKKQQLLNRVLVDGKSIRNFCIMAHVDHGKSTLADNLLTASGLISEKTDCALDFRPDEAKRGITINAASVSFLYSVDDTPYLINLIDSPGHRDFSNEVSKGLRGVDSALLVIDAAEGIKPQTITVVKQAVAEGLTIGLFVNKIDKLIAKVGGNEEALKVKLKDVIGRVNHLLSGLTGIKEYFNIRDGGNVVIGSAKYRWGFSLQSSKANGKGLSYILKNIVNTNECNNELLSREMPLHDAVLRLVVDVFPTPHAAQSKKIDAMWASYYSDEEESKKILPYEYVKNCDTSDPFVGVVTFISHDKDLGSLTSVRVLSGTLKKGTDIFFGSVPYKVNRVSLVMGAEFLDVPMIPAGGLGLIQGLKEAKLGCTLSSTLNFPSFDNISYTQEPVVTVTIKAVDHADDGQLSEILNSLVNQNGTIECNYDERYGEYVLKGVGELQLQVEIDRIRDNHGIKLNVGELKLRYREILLEDGQQVKRRSKLGHTDLIVDVKKIDPEIAKKLFDLTADPNFKLKNAQPALEELGYDKDFYKSIISIHQGCILRDMVKGRSYIKEIHEHLAEGSRDSIASGPLIGAPIIGLEIQLIDALLHCDKVYRGPGEICPTVFHAIKDSIAQSNKTVLEPYNLFTIVVNYEHVDNTQVELMIRRARVQETEYFDEEVQLKGIIPMRELKGLKDALLSVSAGSTELDLSVYGYLPVTSKTILNQIISEHSKEVKNNE